MVKIKLIRTAGTVMGGFRYAEKGGGIGSLLLDPYNRTARSCGIRYKLQFTTASGAQGDCRASSWRLWFHRPRPGWPQPMEH
jgi:hypothetical protein